MIEPVENFLSLDRVVQLVAEDAAVAPAQARSWVSELVQNDTVRLRDTAGNVGHYSATPEVAAERAARASQRPAPGRYNPNSYARLRRERSSSPPAPKPPSAIDQIFAAGYAGHPGDLEKGLASKAGSELDLRTAASKSAAAAATAALGDDATPIDRIIAYLREKGSEPAFMKMPQSIWKWHALRAGLPFTKEEWRAAWRIAKQRGYVVGLKGPATKDKRVKLVEASRLTSQHPQVHVPLIKKASAT